MRSPVRIRRHSTLRASRSIILKAKKTITDHQMRILYRVIAIAGHLFALISVLRRVTGQPTERFMFVTNALILMNHPVRIILNLRKPHALVSTLWTLLWLDKNFHSSVFVAAVLKAGDVPFLFYLIYLLRFFVRLNKIVLEKVVPRMEELSVVIRDFILTTTKSDELGIAIALMEIAMCPVLLISALDKVNVPMGMAAFVCAFLYLPHMYLVDKSHRLIWKWLNIAYTQAAYDNQEGYGTVMLKVLNVFVEFTELCFVVYPARYIRRMLYEDADA